MAIAISAPRRIQDLDDYGDAHTWAGDAEFQGDVGIGTSTPSEPLEVNGYILAKSESATGLVIRRYADGSFGSYIAGRHFRGSISSPAIVQADDTLLSVDAGGYDGNSSVIAASIDFKVDGTPGDEDMPGRIIFRTTADGAASPSVRMVIRQDGKVGIGTVEPGSELEVTGNIELSTPGTSTRTIFANRTTGIFLLAGTTSSSDGPYLSLYGDTHATKAGSIAYGAGQGATGTDQAHLFVVYNGATWDTLATILANGNVGIGLGAPNSILEINMATENLEFVDAGSTGATEQDWIEVEVGGVTGYIRVFASK